MSEKYLTDANVATAERPEFMNGGFVPSGGVFPFERGACRSIGGSCVYRKGLQPRNQKNTCPNDLQSRWECMLSFFAQRVIHHTRPWERDAGLAGVSVAPYKITADWYDRLIEATLSFIKTHLSECTANDADAAVIADAARERQKSNRPVKHGRKQRVSPYTNRAVSRERRGGESQPNAECAYVERRGAIDFLYGLLRGARSADQTAVRDLFPGPIDDSALDYDGRTRLWQLLLRLDVPDRAWITGEVDRLHTLYAKSAAEEKDLTAVPPLGPNPERDALWDRLGRIKRMRLTQRPRTMQAPTNLADRPLPPQG